MPFLSEPPTSLFGLLDTTFHCLNSELEDLLSPTSLILVVVTVSWLLHTLHGMETRIKEVGGSWAYLKISIFRVFKKLPCVKSKIKADIAKFKTKLNTEFTKDMHKPTLHLPKQPISGKAILKKMKEWGAVDDKHPMGGKLSATVFESSQEWRELVCESIKVFLASNPLHFDCFPKVRQLEAQIVSMTAHLFNGDSEVRGTTTSGGTESLLSAILAYREWGRERGIAAPNVQALLNSSIAPTSVHVAIEKAAYYFGVQFRKVPLAKDTFRVNLKEMRALIDHNSVALIVSAPDYPFGVIDNVEQVSNMALQHGINCHVDACMGSYLLPFVQNVGLTLPFCCDFRNPGVTSISCDTHKFGCGPKGLSVLLYRNEQLRALQFYVSVNWQGGIYLTPGMPGSRPGAIIAATWAVMNSLGRKGYEENCKNIVGTCQAIARKLKTEFAEEVDLVGETGGLCIVAFNCKGASNFGVQVEMGKRGWHLALTQHPVALSFCVTRLNWKNTRAHFLNDLRASIKQAPRDVENTTKAVYGLMTQIPDSQSVKEILANLMGALFELPEVKN